jgi:hypothetical protein
MSPLTIRSWTRIIAVSLLALVALWIFTSRSVEQTPARPAPVAENDTARQVPATIEQDASTQSKPETENDADAPRPDHPSDAVLFRNLSLQDENGNIPLDGLTRGVAHAKAMAAAQTTNAPNGGGIGPTTWTWLGPGNIGGRIRSIVISPTNANAMWIGSVSGGIWKTTDGGATWHVVDDFMANLAVSTLIMDPINPAVMYAGTGEGFYNGDGIRGAGVFKSSDGGTTWAQLPTTANANWLYVNRLAISPNGTTLLAATRSGIWRSIDGGSIWTRVVATEALDVNFDPTDNMKAIASSYSGLAWYSTDGGATWNAASGVPGAADRVEVAYAPSNPAIVYASVDVNGGTIYSSTNGGQSYTQATVSASSYLGTQGWYDNIIWVDPTNPAIVIVGGIDLWRSTNSGSTLTKISQWFSAPSSAHADHHAIVNDPSFNGTSNKTVYFGNDGGIYRTTDVYAVANTSGWQELNNNLGITQFYGAAGNPTTGVIVGGTQDNGTLRYSGNTESWTAMFGGDGGFDAADPTNSNYFYGEYVYLEIHRSTNGGASSNYIYSGIGDAGSCANFIAPFVLDPNNANTMLAGGCQLWRSTNVKAATPSWASIKTSTGSYISAIAIAPGNSDIMWVGYNNGDVYSTTNGTLVAPIWNRADLGTPNLPNRQVTRITIDPTDAQKVYVTFGGFSANNVYRTTDGGATWADITGTGLTGLPDVPVRSLVINPTNANWLYVGTEVGIFTSEDGGGTWGVPQDGPANVSVDELLWLDTNTLVAATHGRGLYKATLGIPTAQLSAANYSVNEGAGSAALTATLSAAPATTVTVDYATSDGTATAPADYTAISGTLTFTPGVTQTAFNIAIVDDALVENAETFSVTLSNPVSATLGTPSSAQVTIADNDLPTVQLSSAGYSVNENAGTVPITVTLDQATPFTVTVAYASSDGTAAAPGDYITATGILTFTPGVTQTALNVAIVNDALIEGDETFSLTLSNPTNATLGAPASADITIVDDDQPQVQFSSATYTTDESAGTALITVTLKQPAPDAVTVHYATGDGTAIAGSDYTPVSGTLTFTPGLTTATFGVPIINDIRFESIEMLSLTLSTPTNATLGAVAQATLSISDNDFGLFLPLVVKP